MNIADVLFSVAKHAPGRPAVTAEGYSATYAEFFNRVSRIAAGLRSRHGLAPGDRVVLCMENCGEFLETLFGCWAAGLCAVPTNAKLHAREVAHIVESSGARILVTTPGLGDQLASLAGQLEKLQ